MIAGWFARRNSLYWLFSIFLLPNCSSVPKEVAPKKHTVEIKQMRFEPAELTVQKGDTVIWVNHDIVVHDVTEDPGKAWSSAEIQTGEAWYMVATASTDYFCSIHHVMKGKIVVK